MSKIILQEPPAKSLIFGIRAIGYSFSTAVADIIDNCIPVHAKHIDIISDYNDGDPFFAVCDDGDGMNERELKNAMLMGSDRTNKPVNEQELGRYGLGLKAASLSQCREFIVISKDKDGQINAMSFDLDLIEETNQWNLKILEDDETDALPVIDKIKSVASGTIVIWRKFDRILVLTNNLNKSFREAVADAKKHVEWVFHRFYDELEITFDGRRIFKRDPFLLNSKPRQQTGYTQKITMKGGDLFITPHTLPYVKTLSEEEKDLLGNPKSVYDDQGFYLYRNRRLISWGSWLRMGVKSELNKLARIQVDIPSSLDAEWTLDVKKSAAKIPDSIKVELIASVKDSVIRSKRTVNFKGKKEQSVINKVWVRKELHDNKIKYEINRDNPLIGTLFETLGEGEKRLVEMLLAQVETYIPQGSLYNDSINDTSIIVNSGEDAEEEVLIGELIDIIAMCDDNKKEEKLDLLLATEAYQKLEVRSEDIYRRVLGYDRRRV